ncbi:MAG: hypothetical protein SF029_26000 [bacterium]|nr:hypothetical protein [bacterium]
MNNVTKFKIDHFQAIVQPFPSLFGQWMWNVIDLNTGYEHGGMADTSEDAESAARSLIKEWQNPETSSSESTDRREAQIKTIAGILVQSVRNIISERLTAEEPPISDDDTEPLIDQPDLDDPLVAAFIDGDFKTIQSMFNRLQARLDRIQEAARPVVYDTFLQIPQDAPVCWYDPVEDKPHHLRAKTFEKLRVRHLKALADALKER